MQIRSLKPLMMTRGLSLAMMIGYTMATVAFFFALGVTGGHSSYSSASAAAAESSDRFLVTGDGTIQELRLELIRELRAANLADFELMEKAPGRYTRQESSTSVQQDRVTAINELRALNVADFVAMARWPDV